MIIFVLRFWMVAASAVYFLIYIYIGNCHYFDELYVLPLNIRGGEMSRFTILV